MTRYVATTIEILDSDRFGVVSFIRKQYLMLNADGADAELTHTHTHTCDSQTTVSIETCKRMERISANLVNFFGQIDSFTIEVLMEYHLVHSPPVGNLW